MKGLSRVLALLVVLALLIPVSAWAQPQVDGPAKASAADKTKSDVYLVRMADDPVVAYQGGIQGLPATEPAKGKKIDPKNPQVMKYVSFLDSRHADALSKVGGGERLYDYRYSYNGFAAALTASQAAALTKVPGVVAVTNDFLRQPVTDNSPAFLGLSDADGLWADLGGQGSAGEDIIVGVVDTGIWPEHPSFSDQADLTDPTGRSGKRNLAYDSPPADWYGICQSGEQFNQDDCNNKLIGARYYLSGFGHFGVIKDDFKSPRDADGHGTHTSSTAAGNANVEATILGANLGKISGMAPRARVAMYKACWNGDGGGCAGSDLVAAIDQAVADGVDVINYSIGSDTPTLYAEDDIAFLFAANAGVFVAASAGNAGPGAATVGSPAAVPWLTTVGANTQNRTFQGSVVANGVTYTGASVTGGTVVLPIVDAAGAGSELCLVGALDPAKVSGKIVLCKRGTNARVDKSLAVKMAGGLGMVLYNASDTQSLNTDNHWVPSVHINNTSGVAVKTYIASAGAGATAQINGGTKVTIDAPWMADFSSRGPNRAAPDIIKPDVTAPGVNILAGNSPAALLGAEGQLFQAIGGTSMSSPHVAGIGALLKQAHPDWTPAMIKSALMTSARTDVKAENGTTPASPFQMGAGQVKPNSATDPGLVYKAALLDYIKFLCGMNAPVVNPATCNLPVVGRPDPSDLNLASIGIGELAGRQVVKRTVTNVGAAATYTVSVQAPAGITVTVEPSSFTLGIGQKQEYQVTFTSTGSAVLNDWSFGSLTWSDGTHAVRSPIAVFPVALAAPASFSGTGATGTATYSVTAGYAGNFAAAPHGLLPATKTPGVVVDDPTNTFNPAGPGVTVHNVTIPAGTEYARFSLFDDFTDGVDDLDLYVYNASNQRVGASGSGTSAEEVNLVNPPAGTYKVYVHGWQTDGPDANYTLFQWLLDENAAATGLAVTAAPSTVDIGQSYQITIAWNGLSDATKYLGSVTYLRDTTTLKRTIVRIDVP